MSQSTLLTRPRFAPLFWTQLLGAFNDNLYKNALVVGMAFGHLGGQARSADEAAMLINLSAGLFILPFFLFSATAGQLADKLEKSRLIRCIKVAEIFIMLLAAVGLYLQHTPLLMAVLFLMGAQSAMFGPVKYSILPQHVSERELVGANGLIEMGTFAAIILGTLAGTTLPMALVAPAVVVMAVAGYVASRRVPEAPGDPALRLDYNPLRATATTLRFTKHNRAVFLSVLGISWFWFYGALLLAQFPSIARELLGGDASVVALLLTTFSVGIGAGSLLCERMSGERVELGLVPFGSIGMTVFGIDLCFALGAVPTGLSDVGAAQFVAQLYNLRVLGDLAGLGLFGGFYIVPLYAIIQQRSEAAQRSRIIAGNNILNALFMVAAALFALGMRALGLDLPQLLLAAALLNVLVAVYIYTLLPEFLMRFLVWILMHAMYRVRRADLENIPADGPAVLVCNHVSFVDAPLLAAVCRRPIRFVMDHRVFQTPVLSFIFRTGRAIPIAPRHQNAALMERAFEQVAEALREGELVCIFPEGKLTADGEMNTFRAGIERIVETTPVPVVPLALRGLWGSFFSREGGAAMAKAPRGFRSGVEIVCGEAVEAAAVSAPDLQRRVAELRGACA